MIIIFTGIIEETGTVVSVKHGTNSAVLRIQADKIFSDLRIGDSVCTNGVCLTVTGIYGKEFTADVMHETLNRSSLGTLNRGSKVNLERAMSAEGRFGGHFVSGHIDGTGKIKSMLRDDNAVRIKILVDKKIIKYIVEKGSVALDGISLTVASVTENDFEVSVIPHTAQETTLISKKIGDVINIECDIIGKYVEKLLNFNNKNNKNKNSGGLTINQLAENGFV